MRRKFKILSGFWAFLFWLSVVAIVFVRVGILRAVDFAWLWDANEYERLQKLELTNQVSNAQTLDNVQGIFLFITKAMLWSIGLCIVLLFYGLTYYLIMTLIKRTTLVHQQHGIYPLIIPMLDQLKGMVNPNASISVINPNKALLQANTYSRDSTGVMMERGVMPYSEEIHLKAAQLFSNVQATAALAGGNQHKPTASLLREAKNVRDLPPSNLPPTIDGEIVDDINVMPPVAVDDMLKHSNRLGFVMGQNEDTGELAYWDTKNSQQIGIFGANRTGKTSSVATALTLIACAKGWHTIILDPKRGVDWGIFDPYAERIDCDGEAITYQLQHILDEVDKRNQELVDVGVGDYSALPPGEQKLRGLTPWLIVIEELGHLRSQAEAFDTLDQLDRQLDLIMRFSRFTGLHAILIDQRWLNWGKVVKANLKATITFKQGIHQGSSVGYPQADKLASVGEFAFEGTRYMSIETASHVKRLAPLWSVPRLSPGMHLIPRNENTLPKTGARSMSVSEQAATPVTAPTRKLTELQANAFEYLDSNPECTQTELKLYLGCSVKYAHDLWHIWHDERQKGATR